MENEHKAILSKTAKIAGATCIAAGAVALVASGAAVKAITEGGKYLKDTVKKILNDESEPEIIDTEVHANEASAETPIEEESESEAAT